MHIIFAKTFQEASDAMFDGAVPIECSFGHLGSVVDDRFVMDHHGTLSHLEGVALRAYRDHFGALQQQFKDGTVKFVVTGAADADACFAIAALIGELPHPSRAESLASAPPHIKTALTRDLTDFAILVNRMDTAPIGVRLEELPDGDKLMLWNQLASGAQDPTAFHAGVDRWRNLFNRPLKSLLEATRAEEEDRVRRARQAKVHSIIEVKGARKIAVIESEVWGFDVWYGDHAPCIVSLTPSGSVTVGCPDAETAERLFGPGGLKNVWPKLQPNGWGGRDVIGGSPRSTVVDLKVALDASIVLMDSLAG